jgi:metal-dependent HD superfamily phosphatase/phosphodiesterase
MTSEASAKTIRIDQSEIKPVTLENVRAYPKVKKLMDKANEFLGVIGYTEHGRRHGKVVAKTARNILEALGDDGRMPELAAIAGYLHDIGNVINRDHHAQTGAIVAGRILEEMDMPFEESVEIIGAIGNHHEEDGIPVSRITAALILADKADVHRSRVRTTRTLRTDIHDRVNFAVKKSIVNVDAAQKEIVLEISVDKRISSVMEYFEIFMDRMLISKKAANFLDMAFHLDINGSRLL